MIAISTLTQNSAGALVLYELPESLLEDMRARVSRRATLDGAVAVIHSGFAHGDRTFQIKAEITEADAATLKAIHRTETIVWISCKEGFFSGAIEFLKIEGGIIDMSIMIKEKLST